jgi:hypothetical protein
MKTLTAFIKTDDSLTIVIDNTPKTMSVNHPSFDDAISALENGDIDLLDSLFDVKNKIQKEFVSTSSRFGGVEICDDGTILYNGEVIHNYIVDKIFEFMDCRLPFQPLVNFLEKLMENPSKRAVDELYKFLEHKHLPICEDGDFLAYKSVREDYMDHHSGKFSNHVGSVLAMPRNAVCDDADVGCSYGFHAGSYEYASTFGGSGSRLVIVKINPADVVSVPRDCNCQKLRTSRYEVMKDFEEIYNKPLNTEFKSKNSHNQRDSKGRFVAKAK